MVLGKSTLAKIISGLEIPNKGKVLVDEINTSNKKEFLNLRKKVGVVFQNPENQILFNNVFDDIAFTMKNSAYSCISSQLSLLCFQDFSIFIQKTLACSHNPLYYIYN